jgi:hypothetical protein
MQAIVYLIVFIFIVPGARSQSLVDFRNGGITFRTTANRLVMLCNERLVGTNYVAALYYLPGADRGSEFAPNAGFLAYGSNDLAYAHFRDPSTSLPGVWINPIEVGPYRFLDPVGPGEPATLQVRVWDVTLHRDFSSAVQSGEYYVSTPFNYTVPATDSPKEDYYMDNLRASSVPCTPRLSVTRSSNALTLSWPAAAAGFMLEETLGLERTPTLTWKAVPLPYQTNQDRVTVSRPANAAAKRFYRLTQQFP